jgi:hypothetical protein
MQNKKENVYVQRNKNLVSHHDGATSTTYLIEYLFGGF